MAAFAEILKDLTSFAIAAAVPLKLAVFKVSAALAVIIKAVLGSGAGFDNKGG